MSTFFQRIGQWFSPKPAESTPLPSPAGTALPEPVARLRGDAVGNRAAFWIVQHEARWDAQGRLKVYPLPAGDGGGTLEVAGICNKYHPAECGRLAALISAGRHDDALRGAVDYWRGYTDVAHAWTDHPGIEFFLRDTCANRGPGGAGAVLQLALKAQGQDLKIDGSVGPVTKAALAIVLRRYGSSVVLRALRHAREAYERTSYPWKPNRRDESSKFWRGLHRRWEECLVEALKI